MSRTWGHNNLPKSIITRIIIIKFLRICGLEPVGYTQRSASEAAQDAKSIGTTSSRVNDERIISRELLLLRPPTINAIHPSLYVEGLNFSNLKNVGWDRHLSNLGV
jgi:hypothetical protein